MGSFTYHNYKLICHDLGTLVDLPPAAIVILVKITLKIVDFSRFREIVTF